MKEGTLVQISPNIQVDVHGVVSNMLKYAGKIAKVTTSGKFVKLDISSDDWDWSWHELDLIPIELLVGDTVKIADDIKVGKHGVIYAMKKYAGQTTKITEVSDNYSIIRLEIETC